MWFTPQPALRVLFLIFQTGFNCDCLTYLKETYHSVQRIIAELAELSTAYWSAREQMGRQVGEGEGREVLSVSVFVLMVVLKNDYKALSVLFSTQQKKADKL